MSYFKSKDLIKCCKTKIEELKGAATPMAETENANAIKTLLKGTGIPTEDKRRALLICLHDEWSDQKENIQKFLDYDGFNFIKGDQQQEVYKQLVNCLLALIMRGKYGDDSWDDAQGIISKTEKFFESFKDLLESIDHEIYHFGNEIKDPTRSSESIASAIIKNIDDRLKYRQKLDAFIIDKSKIEKYIYNKIALKKVKPVDPMWLLLAVAFILLIFYVINYGILMRKREVVPIATDAKAAETVEILPNDLYIDY